MKTIYIYKCHIIMFKFIIQSEKFFKKANGRHCRRSNCWGGSFPEILVLDPWDGGGGCCVPRFCRL